MYNQNVQPNAQPNAQPKHATKHATKARNRNAQPNAQPKRFSIERADWKVSHRSRWGVLAHLYPTKHSRLDVRRIQICRTTSLGTKEIRACPSFCHTDTSWYTQTSIRHSDCTICRTDTSWYIQAPIRARPTGPYDVGGPPSTKVTCSTSKQRTHPQSFQQSSHLPKRSNMSLCLSTKLPALQPVPTTTCGSAVGGTQPRNVLVQGTERSVNHRACGFRGSLSVSCEKRSDGHRYCELRHSTNFVLSAAMWCTPGILVWICLIISGGGDSCRGLVGGASNLIWCAECSVTLLHRGIEEQRLLHSPPVFPRDT